MIKIKKFLTLAFLISLNINANPSYEESTLINEYQKLLVEGHVFNNLRLKEIEDLAVSNKEYYFLRDSIAGSYFFGIRIEIFIAEMMYIKYFLNQILIIQQ